MKGALAWLASGLVTLGVATMSFSGHKQPGTITDDSGPVQELSEPYRATESAPIVQDWPNRDDIGELRENYHRDQAERWQDESKDQEETLRRIPKSMHDLFQ